MGIDVGLAGVGVAVEFDVKVAGVIGYKHGMRQVLDVFEPLDLDWTPSEPEQQPRPASN